MGNRKSYSERKKILDVFGEMIIKNVWDYNVGISSNIIKGTTNNTAMKQKYSSFSNMSDDQKLLLIELFKESITSTIYDFMTLFDEHSENLKLTMTLDNIEYNLAEISDGMGAEITFEDEDGWIQMFSDLE